jgi:gas vesicle protein
MKRLREAALMGGFFWGSVFGALVALFGAPRLRPAEQIKQVQQQLEADPVNTSIAEGKLAARRRLAELNKTPTLPR